MYRIVAIQPFGCNTTINFISFQDTTRGLEAAYYVLPLKNIMFLELQRRAG